MNIAKWRRWLKVIDSTGRLYFTSFLNQYKLPLMIYGHKLRVLPSQIRFDGISTYGKLEGFV
jgi:hypothetical protein